jgi:hypothetical protein
VTLEEGDKIEGRRGNTNEREREEFWNRSDRRRRIVHSSHPGFVGLRAGNPTKPTREL